MGPAGCRVLIYDPVKIRSSWGAHAIEGYYAGPALHHCRNFAVFASKTRASRVSDTVELRHSVITAPKIAPEYKVIHAISQLKI